MIGFNIVAGDPLVSGGAWGSRANNAATELAARGVVKVGGDAASIAGDWMDEFCQKTFGCSGKDVYKNTLKAVLITAITYGAYKTGQYLVNREPNVQQVKRALSLWAQMNVQLTRIVTLHDVQLFINNFQHLEQYVVKSYTELNNRYGSWVKPWNWTSDMKKAFEKMQLASILFKYQQILTINSGYNEAELLKIATGEYSVMTAYPVCAYVQNLQADMEIVQKFVTMPSYKFASIVQRELNKVLRIIAASDTYITEKRLLQDAITRERLVNAIDRHY